MPDKGWQRAFFDPIPLPGNGKLLTLRDAANYITKLPNAEHDAPEWRAAIEALMLVVEHGGDTMLPRIGITRALYPGETERTPRKKRQGLQDHQMKTVYNQPRPSRPQAPAPRGARRLTLAFSGR